MQQTLTGIAACCNHASMTRQRTTHWIQRCRRAAGSAPAMLVAMVTLPGMPARATVSASRRSSSGLAVSNAGFAILDTHALDQCLQWTARKACLPTRGRVLPW